MAQWVKHLPCKHEDLDLISGTHKSCVLGHVCTEMGGGDGSPEGSGGPAGVHMVRNRDPMSD